MRLADTTMRTVLIVALMTALGGCYSIRHRNDNPDGTASTDKPAPKSKPGKPAKENLPPGLGGDTAHKAYTDTPN